MHAKLQFPCQWQMKYLSSFISFLLCNFSHVMLHLTHPISCGCATEGAKRRLCDWKIKFCWIQTFLPNLSFCCTLEATICRLQALNLQKKKIWNSNQNLLFFCTAMGHKVQVAGVEPETAAMQAWLAKNPVSFAVSLQGGHSLVTYPSAESGKSFISTKRYS